MASTPVAVTGDVAKFIRTSSDSIARTVADRYASGIVRLGIESPIEQVFYVALRTVCDAVEYPIHESEVWSGEQGVHLRTQLVIDGYRVDFAIHQRLLGPNEGPLVVELDGHAFHDKTKEQRAYEKGRDRRLVARGFRVIHYTGSEVWRDPFRVANEVLGLLISDGPEYDPGNPLSQGDRP